MPAWDDRDFNWLGYRTYDILLPQVDKIRSNMDNSMGGWEAWVQFELAYGLTQAIRTTEIAANASQPGGIISLDFEREQAYQDIDFKIPGTLVEESSLSHYVNPKISDFKIKASFEDEPSEFHWVELKCRSSKETNNSFVDRVSKDIAKAKDFDWDREVDPESLVSIWVLAISVGDDSLEGSMQNAARQGNIEWNPPINLTNDGFIKIWTYCRHVQGFRLPSESLFAYSTLARLQQEYNEYRY